MKDEQGVTLIGLLLIALIIILGGLVAMRVVPVYVQNYQVASSMKALNGLDKALFSSDEANNETLLQTRLMNQLSINGMDEIKLDQIKVSPVTEGHYRISVEYTVVKPFMFNVSLLFNFVNEEEVTIGQH